VDVRRSTRPDSSIPNKGKIFPDQEIISALENITDFAAKLMAGVSSSPRPPSPEGADPEAGAIARSSAR
jgi:hypothetical protein